ncbi:MAG: transglutaminase family protein [Opitutales bacterium]|nr:transglutaminase family protein [Opitutales bacterium]
MHFRVTHQTKYQYGEPARDSFGELRVRPLETPYQKIVSRELQIEPQTTVERYQDYFGNEVEFFSLPFLHRKLSVRSTTEVITHAQSLSEELLTVPVGDVRQILNPRRWEIFDYLQTSFHVHLKAIPLSLRKKFCHPNSSLREALLEVNTWIYENFLYQSGVTDVNTSVADLLQKKAGVCQDFSHLMLALLRANGLPARYVSGYIEPHDPTQPGHDLVGAAASHAWVEVALPGGQWWGLDPTNNQITGERHIKVAVGRDYRDVTPLRGSYQGGGEQEMSVKVDISRLSSPSPSPRTRTLCSSL